MTRKPVPILSVIRPRTKRLFRAKLKREGDCLVFTGTRNARGYGFVDVTYACKRVRFPILAHRLAWVLSSRLEIPLDRIVCHRCNNPSCCNPKHLYLGTPATNAADKVRAGRCVSGMKGVKGEAHPASKYTDARRFEAIAMRKKGLSLRDIAKVIGCTPDTAGRWWRQREG